MSTSGAIRVGAVSYLNAKPLYEGFGEFATGALLEIDVPSRLADRLARGDLDVGLIPSVEYFRGLEEGLPYEILPNLAIAAEGPVRSVKLFSRLPFGQIERLALDEGSRTSQALALVWLFERHGVRPSRVETLPIGVPARESTADAVLVIGDRAMKTREESFVQVVDLAEAWNELTGLPFVFALWVARSDVEIGDLPEQLERCRNLGLARAQEIAGRHGPRLGLDVATCYDYLTNVLSYDLGEPELAGLRTFARKAAGLGLISGGAELVFHRRRDLATRR